MDYVTRQFINLAKKFRKELPKIAELLRNDIKQQTDAIREARDAYDQGRDTPPVLRAELQVPHPIEVRTEPKDKKTGREWFKLGVETLTLLAVIWYAYEAHRQFPELKKSAEGAGSSADTAAKQEAFLEVSQRPWIEVTNPSTTQQQTIPPVVPLAPYQPMLQDAGYAFSIMIKIYGNTPALRSYGRMNPRFVNLLTLPSPILPFMKNVIPQPLESCSTTATWEDGTSTYFPSGSYQILSNEQITSTEDMNKLIHAKQALFWVGCVRYEDAFKRRYQTNFCFYWSIMDHPLGWSRCFTGNDLIEYPQVQPK